MSDSPNSRLEHINYKQRYEAFLEGLNPLTSVEEKLRNVVDFMEATLSVEQAAPHFKSFWDARTIAMQLFKENIAPAERLTLWERYSALSKESRRLKSLFDEQGAFASEQIEIAIRALEEELENLDAAIAKMSEPDFLQGCMTLAPKKQIYYTLQSKLHLLNAQASRITALRKELIHTEIRIRLKNKFYQRLSSAGDKVFPQRKELIKVMSDHFTEDVHAFIEHHFAGRQHNSSFFALREEIKILQGVAKELTLNTQAFTKTRLQLSECWDKLRLLEKERKKIRVEQNELFKKNAEHIKSKLDAVKQALEAGELSDHDASDQCDEIADELHHTTLGKDQVRDLRETIILLQRPLQERLKAEEQQRILQIQEKEKLKKFKSTELRNAIDAFMLDLDNYDLDSVVAKRDEFLNKIADLPATKVQKQALEALLKPVKDAIVDKKEQALMALSDNDRQVLQELNEILKQRLEQRDEIKCQLEFLRKARSSSGLDFEQAMNVNLRKASEQERLEKVLLGIEEIQNKISMHKDLGKKG